MLQALAYTHMTVCGRVYACTAERTSQTTHLGLASFPNVSADGLHNALAHLNGSLGGLIPSPHLLGMPGNLSNLDNLL